MPKDRNICFDIAKGILIILVVIGHYIKDINEFHRIIYWFHMPAFFIISGYFFKPIGLTKALFIKTIKRYVVPYFSFSIIFYLIYRPEGLLKNFVRILYAGNVNTTLYSYPFWFINTLFVSCMALHSIYSFPKEFTIKIHVFVVIVSLVLLYVIFPYNNETLSTFINFPWGIGQMFLAIIYMSVGMLMKEINYRKYLNVSVLICVIYVLLDKILSVDYNLNFKNIAVTNVLLDMIVPLLFTNAIICISSKISKIKYISEVLSYVGLSCIYIFYIHAACLYTFKQIFGCLSIIIPIVIGCFMNFLTKKNKYIQLLFSGK